VRAMAEVCTGAEKHVLARGRTSHRLDDKFKKQAGVLDAIARARAEDEHLSGSSPTLDQPQAEPETPRDEPGGERP